MQVSPLVQDIAAALLTSGVGALVFKKLRLPLLMGYMVAGLLIGPNSPIDLNVITQTESLRILADLGVLFIMFSLGLEFGFKRLKSLGMAPILIVSIEAIVMWTMGMKIGEIFNFSHMGQIFLGASLTISSTTVILKTLEEYNLKSKRFADRLYGILLSQDIVAILILVYLSGISSDSLPSTDNLFAVASLLVASIVLWWFLGSIFAPKFLRQAYSSGGHELMTISSIGLCLSLGVLATKLNFSAALGAFLMGSVFAETREVRKVENLINPVKDIFAALFFFSFGTQLVLDSFLEQWKPILVLSMCLVGAKVCFHTFTQLLFGSYLKTSIRVGSSLGQIGEFSFVIVTIAVSQVKLSDPLFSIVAGTSFLTIMLTPFLMRGGVLLSHRIYASTPSGVLKFLDSYSTTLQELSFRRFLIPTNNQGLTAKLLFLGRFFYQAIKSNYAKATEDNSSKNLKRLAPWDGYLVEVELKMGSIFAGQSLIELNLREDYGINIAAIERDSGAYISPSPIMRLFPNDKILVYGLENDITHFSKVCATETPPRHMNSFNDLHSCETGAIILHATHPFVGQRLRTLNIREDWGCTVLAVERGEERIKNPPATFAFQEEDRLFLIGSSKDIQRMRKIEKKTA